MIYRWIQKVSVVGVSDPSRSYVFVFLCFVVLLLFFLSTDTDLKAEGQISNPSEESF